MTKGREMGCDIHCFAERKDSSGNWSVMPEIAPFNWRNYGLFGFFAGIRNYSEITPASTPRGIPGDASIEVKEAYDAWRGDAHSASWLSVQELATRDYEAQCEDRRVMRQTGETIWNGGCTCLAGDGVTQTLREFLGEEFFDDLKALQDAGADRVVFWFDN